MAKAFATKEPAVNGETAAPVVKTIRLRRIEDEVLEVEVVGITPYIAGKWSEKAKGMMRDSQAAGGKSVRPKREPKIPKEEAESRTWRLPDGTPGIPAVAFKGAMVEGCRLYEGISMTEARRILFVQGEGPEQLVRISYDEQILREDAARNATGVADLRYRHSFWKWSAVLTVRFPKGVIDADSVIALLDAGGRSGVGEWRPGSPKSNTGTYGQFRVRTEDVA
jgi:hypothetical protein